ncbi:hypothetical protein BDF14DRAFT_1882034 [Spinellus fusiger]|nr:hypothetical protein BDF14DRAFT_1882034 [Spinellus fusiger]
MSPQLPLKFLILLGSASIYGLNKLLDNLEHKTIAHHSPPLQSPPRPYSKSRLGTAAVAATGLFSAGYWLYTHYSHRPSPGISTSTSINTTAFYQDQHSTREAKWRKEADLLRQKDLQQEKAVQQRLMKSHTLMEQVASHHPEP